MLNIVQSIKTCFKPEDLNDDKLGRVMDKLYRHGLSKLFLIIALEVVKKYKISTKYSYLDSTSLHLHGEYNNRLDNQEKELEIISYNPILITQGYSRDYRPDLKQCFLDLIVSSDGDIPLFFRGGSGKLVNFLFFLSLFEFQHNFCVHLAGNWVKIR